MSGAEAMHPSRPTTAHETSLGGRRGRDLRGRRGTARALRPGTGRPAVRLRGRRGHRSHHRPPRTTPCPCDLPVTNRGTKPLRQERNEGRHRSVLSTVGRQRRNGMPCGRGPIPLCPATGVAGAGVVDTAAREHRRVDWRLGMSGFDLGVHFRRQLRRPVGERGLTSSAAARVVRAVRIQPAVCTPCCVPTMLKANAMGRNTIQEIALAPEETPVRIVDGTASCKRRVTWMLAITISRASVACAIVTTTTLVVVVSATLARVMSAVTAARVAGRPGGRRPASIPPRPRVDIRTAQYGPYRTAGAASATSQSGPNSRISGKMTEASTARAMIGSICLRRVRIW